MANLNNPEEFQRILYESAWLLRTGDATAAAEKLLPLYEVAPTNPDVVINLGGAYIMLGKWNKAERVLGKAAEVHPENVMIWTNLAAAHLGRLELAGPRQQERAIRAYERALALDPKAPNIYYHLGLVHKERRDWTSAQEAFTKALEVNPADKDARYWLSWLTQQNANPDAAGENPVQANEGTP